MALLELMMTNASAAIDEINNVVERIFIVKECAQTMVESAGEIGHETLVGAAQAIVDACEEALGRLDRDLVVRVAHAVQNAGGDL